MMAFREIVIEKLLTSMGVGIALGDGELAY